jgi:DNA-binding MarR family transcriptional regulator
MTRLVSALENDGLVTRETDPADGRLTRIRATPRGRTLLLQGRARRVAVLTNEVRALSTEDRDRLVRAVATVEAVIAKLR